MTREPQGDRAATLGEELRQIRDGSGEVHLSFDGALTLLQWLDEQKAELTRAVNGPNRETDEHTSL